MTTLERVRLDIRDRLATMMLALTQFYGIPIDPVELMDALHALVQRSPDEIHTLTEHLGEHIRHMRSQQWHEFNQLHNSDGERRRVAFGRT